VGVRHDLAYLTGSDDITAKSLSVQVLEAKDSSNKDEPSSFDVEATSGVGKATSLAIAGSVAINVVVFDHDAYLDSGATLTLHGSPDLTVESHSDLTFTTKALAATVKDAGKTGVGASVAFGYGEDNTLATVNDGASFAGSGAKGLTLDAESTNKTDTEAKNGAKGSSTAVTPVIAISVSNNDAEATLGTGSLLTIGPDGLKAAASLTNGVQTQAEGETEAKTAVGISFALSIVNDKSLATTGRDLLVTGSGAAAFMATTISGSESRAKSSAKGADDEYTNNSKSEGNTDDKTKAQKDYADKTAKDKASANGGTAKGNGASADSNSQSTSDGQVSVAAAIAVNIENASATASIPDGRHVTSGGVLTVMAAENADGHANADGEATSASGGTGIGAAVAVNVNRITNQGFIGNNTIIAAGGLSVGAVMADRSVKAPAIAPDVVTTDTSSDKTFAKDSIFVGLDAGLQSGDQVAYFNNFGSSIGGLSSDITGLVNSYYVHVNDDGTVRFYDSQAHAEDGGDTGLVKLTSTGSGSEQWLGKFVEVSGVSAPNFITPIKFNPTGKVTLLNAGDDSMLRTGDPVTYDAKGGSAIGGIVGTTTYYVIDVTGGHYQLAATHDDAIDGKAIALSGTGNDNQVLHDKAHSSHAEAKAGAGGDGKIGVAGAVSINVVNDNTNAWVGFTPGALAAPHTASITITGNGDVSVAGESRQANFSRAEPADGGASGSKAGIGASVAVDVLTNNVESQIVDGTSWAGTAGKFSVTADTDDAAFTHGENGASSSGSVAVGVGVAVLVAQDTTTAYVGTGTGTISAGGDIKIAATHNGDFKTTTDGKAASKGVGVGASVSVAVVIDEISAELARNITTTGGAFTLASTSTVMSDVEAVATSQGAKDDDNKNSSKSSGGKTGADGQADKQVNDNSNTKQGGGKTDLPSAKDNANSGDSKSQNEGNSSNSAKVGVAGAVGVNVVTAHNNARITHGADVTATGAVKISAVAEYDAIAKGVGAALGMDNDTNIGVGVALNVVNASNQAYVDSGGSVVQGQSIAIEAKTPDGKADDFIAWGASAAASTSNNGKASVAGSVAINVINSFDTKAYAASGSQLKAATSGAGTIGVNAVANFDLQTVAAAGAFSSKGSAVGATINVSVMNTNTTAYIEGNADAGGAITVNAGSHLLPTKIAIPHFPDSVQPTATSVAIGAAVGGGDAAVEGSIVVNVLGLDVDAHVGNGSQINQSAGYGLLGTESLTVTATNETQVTSLAGSIAASKGSAGIGVGVDVEVLNKHTKAYVDSNARVSTGGLVNVTATSTETMLSIAATIGASTGEAGVALSVAVADIHPETDAWIGSNAVVNAGGAVTVEADDTFVTTMIAGSVGAADEAGIGAAANVLVHGATTQAWVDAGANVTAGGKMKVAASESEDVIDIAAAGGAASEAAVAGSAAIVVLNETTTAAIKHGATVTVNGGADLDVTASDSTTITNVAGSIAASGEAGVGVGASVDTVIKDTNAFIGSGVTATINGNGNLVVSATSSENLIGVSAGLAAGGEVGVGANAGVSVFNLHTRAFIGDGPGPFNTGSGPGDVHATGTIAIAADDETNINDITAVLAVGGTVGVGAAVGVNVMTKDTEAFVGAGAKVTADGLGAGLTVNTGAVGVSFDFSAPTFATGGIGFGTAAVTTGSPGTVNLGNGTGLQTGSRVIYHNGTGNPSDSIGGLTDGTGYFVRDVGGGNFKFYNSQSDAQSDTGAIALTTQGNDQQRVESVQGIEASSSWDAAASTNPTDRANLRKQGQVNTPQLAPMNLSNGGGDNVADKDSGDSSLKAKRGAAPTMSPTAFHGLAVAATDTDEVRTFTFSLGAGEVGVAVSAGVDVVSATTHAYIGANATVNAGSPALGGAGNVLVGAGDDFYHLAIAGSAAGGYVGVAPAVGVNVISNDTQAFIDHGATVNAANDIVVAAGAKENVIMVGFGVAGGFVGVGGAVDVLSISNKTYASIGDSATVYAGNNVAVMANDDTHVLELSGALAGGFVGVGGSVGVMIVGKDTEATIGTSANVDALGKGALATGLLNGDIDNVGASDFSTTNAHKEGGNGVIVQATSSEDILHIVAAAAGGFVGVSGAVGVTLIKAETDAAIDGSAKINQAHQGLAGAAQSVYVGASDKAGVQTFVIGIAGGFVGVSGAVDVGSITDNTKAEIDGGAMVAARKDVKVNAVAMKHIEGFDASGAGGFVGVGGAVSVWSIGSQINGNYHDENGHSANSTQAVGHIVKTGDVDTGARTIDLGSTQGFTTGSQVVYDNHGGPSMVANGTYFVGAVPSTSEIKLYNSADDAKNDVNAIALSAGNDNQTLTGKNATADGDAAAEAESGTGTVTNSQAGGINNFQKGSHPTNSSQDRMASGMGQAVSGVDSKAPKANGPGGINDLVNATPTPPGTSAIIHGGSTVAAGHDIDVKANEADTIHILTGQVAGGFVGAGAAISVLSIADNVTASATGNLSATDALNVNANFYEHVSTQALDAAVGAVSLGAAVAVVSDSSATQASLGGAIDNTGSVNVEADSNRSFELLTGKIGSGAVSIGVTFTRLDVTGDTTASIYDGTQIGQNGPVGSVTVLSKAIIDAKATTGMFDVGGVTVDAAFAFVDIASNVNATVGNSVEITTSGPVSVTADATKIKADSEMLGVSVGAGMAVLGMLGKGTVEGGTSASIGSDSTITSAGTPGLKVFAHDEDNEALSNIAMISGGAINAAGAVAIATVNRTTRSSVGNRTKVKDGTSTVEIDATANNMATANTMAGSGSLAGITVAAAISNIGGDTTASVGAGGSVTGDLHVKADDTSVATPTTKVLGIGAVFSGTGATAGSKITRNVDAYLGNPTGGSYSQSTFTLNGSADVEATSHETANVFSEGVSGGAVAGGFSVPDAEVNGVTRAYIGPNTTVDGSASNSSITLTSSDTSKATVEGVGVAIGAISGAIVSPTATVGRDSKAFIDNAGQALAGAGTVLLDAGVDEQANAKASGGSGGAVTINAMEPAATLSGTTSTYVGAGGQVSAGALMMTAHTISRKVDAKADTLSIGLGLAVGVVDSTASITGTVSSYIDAGSTINVSGAVALTAASSANPTAEASVGQGGAISAGIMTSTVSLTNTTEAYIGDNTQVTKAGSLDLEANDTTAASITGQVAGGGVGEARGAKTVADVEPTIDAHIGKNVTGNVVNDVTVRAQSIRAEGDATAKDYGGGVVDFGNALAKVTTKPKITALIDTGSSITAGGSVTVDAEGLSTPGQSFDDHIQAVDTTNDLITFPSHGLSTGDSVTYKPNSPSPILTANGALQSGLVNNQPRLYNVIVTDSKGKSLVGDLNIDPNATTDKLALGDLFDATTVNALAPFQTSGGVDAARSMIRFAIPHNFQTGDSVLYSALGNGNVGLTENSTDYFVRVIDPFTVELYASLADATSSATNVGAGGVNSVDHTIGALSTFGDATAVTYRTPAPIAFSSGGINVDYHGDSQPLSDHPGANNIFVGAGTGFQDGDQIVFRAANASGVAYANGTNIGGLVVGNTYYVITTKAAVTSSTATPTTCNRPALGGSSAPTQRAPTSST
jgi:hypothetical protein